MIKISQEERNVLVYLLKRVLENICEYSPGSFTTDEDFIVAFEKADKETCEGLVEKLTELDYGE